jgi:hypothetical protein
VNEFGMGQFPDYVRTPQSAPPVRQDSGSSKPFLVLLLILSCVLLGALLSWGIHERFERAVLSVRNEKLANAYTVVLAKRSDLAGFLTDHRTKLYRLKGRGKALGQSVTIAWQEETGRGLLLGEHVPAIADGQVYAVWHVDQKNHVVRGGTFREDPAGTFYDFRVIGSSEGTQGFRVSLESNSNVDKPGEIVYETN